MNFSHLSSFLWLLIVASTSFYFYVDRCHAVSVSDDDDDDSLIQVNPDFVETNKENEHDEKAANNDNQDNDDDNDEDDEQDDDDEEEDEDEDEEDDDDDDDDDEEEEEEEEEEEKRVKIAKRKKKKLSSSSLNKRALQLYRKHKKKLIAAIILYTFRKEVVMGARVIWRMVYFFLSEPTGEVDSDTGKRERRLAKISLTAILKIVIFILVMNWQLKKSRESRDPTKDSGSAPELMLLGPRYAILGAILQAVLSTKTAYLPPIEQHWTFEQINERYTKDAYALEKASKSTSFPTTQHHHQPHSGQGMSQFIKSLATGALDSLSGSKTQHSGTVIIIEMSLSSPLGGISPAAQLDLLRDQVNFLISQHRANQTRIDSQQQLLQQKLQNQTSNATIGTPWTTTSAIEQETAQLEIVLSLESPGGGIAEYGLAAQQLMRLRREPGIRLTICVDKVAASGGYMMASTASPGRLYGAPFALFGSIGVYGQIINVQEALTNRGVNPLVFRSGKNKAPLGMIGQVTKSGKETVQATLDAAQRSFKRHVVTARPILRNYINELATGDVWLGYDALHNGLVDRLVTFDEYISERVRDGARVLKLLQHGNGPSGIFGGGSRLPFSTSAAALSSWGRQLARHAWGLVSACGVGSNLGVSPGGIMAHCPQASSSSAANNGP